MKFCLRGCLAEAQRATLMLFFDALRDLTAESHTQATIRDAKDSLSLSLALLERDFPVTLMVINLPPCAPSI